MGLRTIPLVCLFVTLGACFALWRGQLEFNTQVGVEHRLSVVSRQATEERIRRISLENRMKDFQQEVALFLPRDKSYKIQESVRDLASVIPHTAATRSELALSRQALLESKSLFDEKKYEEATESLVEIVTKYPESPASLEASYYLIQSFMETKNKQEAMSWAERMIRQFPESLWTARSMILLADMYREQDRRNEALDTYQMIMSTFEDEDIRNSVKKKMNEMGL